MNNLNPNIEKEFFGFATGINSFPEPFCWAGDYFPSGNSKKIPIGSTLELVTSGGTGESTLIRSIIHAALAYARTVAADPSSPQLSGHGLGEIQPNGVNGLSGVSYIAEYQSSNPGRKNVAVYTPDTGTFKGFTCKVGLPFVKPELMTLEPNDKQRATSAVLFLAMMPEIIKDEEAVQCVSFLVDKINDFDKASNKKTFPHNKEMIENAAVLCHNVYLRIKKNTINSLKVDLTSLRMPIVTKERVDRGDYRPTKVLAGSFEMMKTVVSGFNVTPDAINIAPGAYKLKLNHDLSIEEEKMIYVLPESHRNTAEELRLCEKIHRQWEKPNRVINVLLEGEAGTGKTELAKALSSRLHIPYTKYSCFPTMEQTDLVGAYYPVEVDEDNADLTERETKILELVKTQLVGDLEPEADTAALIKKAMENPEAPSKIRQFFNIPEVLDIEFDPEGAYEALTGSKPTSEVDALDIRLMADKAYNQIMTELVALAAKKKPSEQSSGVPIRFIESEIVKAFRNGWLIEIQEAATILQAGVLSALNSIMEPNGRLELPTGECVYRHPDTIVVITTNRNYAGCQKINESLRDRVQAAIKMELPPESVMLERLLAITDCKDIPLAMDMVKTINILHDAAISNGISGTIGMRSLVFWLEAVMAGDDVAEALNENVLWKVTTDDDELAILVNEFENNSPLASYRAKTI